MKFKIPSLKLLYCFIVSLVEGLPHRSKGNCNLSLLGF